MHTQTHIHTHTHTHMQTNVFTCTHAQTHTHSYRFTCTSIHYKLLTSGCKYACTSTLTQQRFCSLAVNYDNYFYHNFSIEMFVTLELKDKSYLIHSISNGEKTITINDSFSIIPWKMLSPNGKLISLKESVKLIEAENHERELIDEFVRENKELVDHFLSIYKSMSESKIAKSFSKIYEFGPEKLVVEIGDLQL